MPKFSLKLTGEQYRSLADKIPVPPMTMKDDDRLTLNYNLDLGSLGSGKMIPFLRLMSGTNVTWEAEGLDDKSVYIVAEVGRLLVDLMHAQKEKLNEDHI